MYKHTYIQSKIEIPLVNNGIGMKQETEWDRMQWEMGIIIFFPTPAFFMNFSFL